MKPKIKHDLEKGFLFFLILVLFPVSIIIYGILSVILDQQEIVLHQQMLTLAIFILPVVIVYLLCIKTYFHSQYIIEKDLLICIMGLFKSSINIKEINYLKKGKYPAAGKRPALNINGIKVSYGNGYSIFLSPKNEDKFIKDLKSANENIIVKTDV